MHTAVVPHNMGPGITEALSVSAFAQRHGPRSPDAGLLCDCTPKGVTATWRWSCVSPGADRFPPTTIPSDFG